jgi:hypothetical protein
MLQNDETHDLCSLKSNAGHFNREYKMGGACGTHSGEGTYKDLVKIPKGKKLFERTSKGREGNRVMLK